MDSIFKFIILLSSLVNAQLIPFAFFNSLDPCKKTPAIGTECSGGAFYAGQFDGGKYMITPGGCTDSATPTCDGSVDTVYKVWRGTAGNSVDIPGVENLATVSDTSSSAYRGDVNTAAAVAHASIDSDSAPDYCNNMTFGGYDDWYLPSKSELSFIYCHSNQGHSASYPNEDPDCASVGGKTSDLTGFRSDHYWSSTETSTGVGAYKLVPNVGRNATSPKEHAKVVRCIRRY